MTRNRLIITAVLAALVAWLWLRRGTIDTPHGRVLVPAWPAKDPLEEEMETWLSQHPNGR